MLGGERGLLVTVRSPVMTATNEQLATSDELLSINGISKAFFGVPVLKVVTFKVQAGQILGLVGENGAGKSTLMNVIGGNVAADDGNMRFAGSAYRPGSPRDARKAGIGFVHQELNLFSNLSIAENLFLTNFPTKATVIRESELRRKSNELLRRVGLELSPETLVEQLSSGERQLVEIAHALSFEARLIILDEPTTSLTRRECERLFELLRRLRSDGRSIIFISHALGDVLKHCDEIVVLRDGEVVARGARAEFDQDRLVSLMVGRELKQLFPSRDNRPVLDHLQVGAPAQEEPLLEVRNVSQPGVVRDISFTLHRGEVLGISGLMGAGRTELARILFGLDPHAHGRVSISGRSLRASPSRRIQQGLAMLTESRREDGLCLEASIADNMALVTLPHVTKSPLRLLDTITLKTRLAHIREAVRLQPGLRLEHPARTLSGGNQQKVVLAKWLLTEPEVLILDEPTRGIDVGARFEIYQLILALADRGAGILMISSEIEELIGLCDRLIVLRRGKITSEFSRAQFDREEILRAALSVNERGEAVA